MCKQDKPRTDFFKRTQAKDKLQSVCKTCSMSNKEERAVYARRYHLRSLYGITLADYERLLEAQNGVCAICKAPPESGRALAVDHVHDTKKVRGLLCVPCNVGLGAFKENPELFRLAVEYLEQADLGE